MLGIIIVNYKTIEETVGYIRHELIKIKTPSKVVVVDVACNDIAHSRVIANKCGGQLVETFNSTTDRDKQVYVLPHKDNLGYAKGNNYGASFLQKHYAVNYLLFTNNDVTLRDHDVVERLIEIAEQKEDVAAIGPRVLDLDEKDQSPRKDISIWKKYIWPQLLMPIMYFLPDKDWFCNLGPCKTGYCYWVPGSFVLVKASAFFEANGFDPATFLYAEEAILAERLMMLGYREYFVKSVVIIHHHGGATKKFLKWKQGMKNAFESDLYYFTQYRKVNRLSLLLARAANYCYLNVCLECGKRAKKWMSIS